MREAQELQNKTELYHAQPLEVKTPFFTTEVCKFKVKI